jgi:hypothetical protein
MAFGLRTQPNRHNGQPLNLVLCVNNRNQGVSTVKDIGWAALSIEFVIVAVGMVAGFQISEWGETQESRQLGAQNLHRAIKEAEHNLMLVDKIVARLDDESIVFESVLSELIECDRSLTRSEIEKLMKVLGNDFLPSFQSSQVTNLALIKYAPFYTEDFLEALPIYLERHDRIDNATAENHKQYFDWRFLPEMLDIVTVREGDPSSKKDWRFVVTANPDELRKNPEAQKRIWRLWVLRTANKEYYKGLKRGISEFIPLMQMQLQLLE